MNPRTRSFSTIVASFFGAGRCPFAPGTAGSLAALPLAWLAAHEPGPALGILGALLVVGIPAATRVSREMGRKDPGIVVIDEVIGMMIAGMGVGGGWGTMAAVFLLFRFFDILKPPPCRQLESLPEGWGIVMDDVAAGLYARLALYGAGSWFS